MQGTVEALQASLSKLSAHVALRARALDPSVAAAAAAAGLEGGDLDLNTLDNMEPEREWGRGLGCLSGDAGFTRFFCARVGAFSIAEV